MNQSEFSVSLFHLIITGLLCARRFKSAGCGNLKGAGLCTFEPCCALSDQRGPRAADEPKPAPKMGHSQSLISVFRIFFEDLHAKLASGWYFLGSWIPNPDPGDSES